MLDFLWHSTYAIIGLSGAIVLGCIAVGYFFPPLRRLAIEIGIAVLTAASIYGKGASDEKRRQQALQKKAEDDAIASGKADRAAAEQDAAKGIDDGFDTDKRKPG